MLLPKIDVPETMLERMTSEDRLYKSAAEMVIHQFESETSSGVRATGNPNDVVNRWTFGRRFREFCKSQFPDMDDWELWKWYRWYLIQTGRYTRRNDLNIDKWTGYVLIEPRMKYQHASQYKPKPQPPKVSDLARYNPEHDMYGGNGHREVLN